MSQQSDELRELVAVMRELHVASAYGVVLGPLPPPPMPEKSYSEKEQDKEKAEEERKIKKFRALFGGNPTPEAWEKMRSIL
jgi:hypothetical protein